MSPYYYVLIGGLIVAAFVYWRYGRREKRG